MNAPDDPTYALLSTESDVPRPHVLREGTLAACLDELKEAVLLDVVACNRSRLEITATRTGGRRPEVVTALIVQTTGHGY
jgi:hypothetical protein